MTAEKILNKVTVVVVELLTVNTGTSCKIYNENVKEPMGICGLLLGATISEKWRINRLMTG